MSLKILKKKNYLTMLHNLANGQNFLFRNFYAEIKGVETDILKDGALSCAVVVSSVLYLQKLIGDIHANVVSTESDMMKSGWFEIDDVREGSIIIWEQYQGKDGMMHYHIGFYIGNDRAVSNDSNGTGFPHAHHYTFGNYQNGEPVREIERIYWHPDLD